MWIWLNLEFGTAFSRSFFASIIFLMDFFFNFRNTLPSFLGFFFHFHIFHTYFYLSTSFTMFNPTIPFSFPHSALTNQPSFYAFKLMSTQRLMEELFQVDKSFTLNSIVVSTAQEKNLSPTKSSARFRDYDHMKKKTFKWWNEELQCLLVLLIPCGAVPMISLSDKYCAYILFVSSTALMVKRPKWRIHLQITSQNSCIHSEIVVNFGEKKNNKKKTAC